MTIHCQHVDYYGGPHPGCAEFDGGELFEVPCAEAATHVVVVRDYGPDCRDGETVLLLVCDGHLTLTTFEVEYLDPYSELIGAST